MLPFCHSTITKIDDPSSATEKTPAPVFPQTPCPEVRKLTSTTLSGNRKLLAASRHPLAPCNLVGHQAVADRSSYNVIM